MKALLIEDDHKKESKIIEVLNEFYPLTEVDVVRSVNCGLSILAKKNFDLILLDLGLPNYPRDSEYKYSGGTGGMEILHWLSSRKIFTPVVIISQNDELLDPSSPLSERLKVMKLKSFPTTIVKGICHYDNIDDQWKIDLTKYITTIKDTF